MEIIVKQTKALINEINELIEETRSKLLEVDFKRNTDVRLIELLFTNPYLTTKNYVECLGIEQRTAQRDIGKLIDYGIIDKKSQNGETYYRNIKLYNLLENIPELEY